MEVDRLPQNFTGICEEDKYGKFWYKDGKLHRVDGPACERTNGTKAWYIDGKIHRLDGPAIKWNSGEDNWYIDDKPYTEEEFNKKMNKKITTCDGKVVEIDGKKYKLTLTN